MFEFLNEITDKSLIRLTTVQQSVLLTIFVAQTPKLALDNISGSRYTVEANRFLNLNGLTRNVDDGVKITSDGYDVLLSYGFIDNTDKLTDSGEKLITFFEKYKEKLSEDSKLYKTLNILT